MHILSFTLCIVLTILSAIHFHWAIGGQWGFDNALPVNENGSRVLNPGKTACAIVGLGLAGFACFYLFQTNIIDIAIPQWLLNIGGWGIPAIFIARAIGDFNYVGFFKKVKNTKFGKLDSAIYSPLCIAIGVIGLALQIA